MVTGGGRCDWVACRPTGPRCGSSGRPRFRGVEPVPADWALEDRSPLWAAWQLADLSSACCLGLGP
eukprot:9679056-Alexandrium_andersonii.AAC.1